MDSFFQILVASGSEDDVLELEEDLTYIIGELALAFDPAVPFHVKNAGEERLLKFQSIPEAFATTTQEPDTVAAPWSGRAGSPEPLRLQQHEWLAYFVNEFGRLNGFVLICQVPTASQHSLIGQPAPCMPIFGSVDLPYKHAL